MSGRARGLNALVVRPAACFALLSLVFGAIVIAVTPPLRGPDENAHFLRAFGIARGEIPARADAELDRSVPVVTYCWGPGCNGATRAALVLAGLGFRVREMLGGFEYWAREGLPVATADGVRTPAVDPLTAVACGC